MCFDFSSQPLFRGFRHPWTELGFCQLSLCCAFYISVSCIASLRVFGSAQCFIEFTSVSHIFVKSIDRLSAQDVFYFFKIFSYIFFHWKTHWFPKLIFFWLILIFASTVFCSVNLLYLKLAFLFDEQSSLKRLQLLVFCFSQCESTLWALRVSTVSIHTVFFITEKLCLHGHTRLIDSWIQLRCLTSVILGQLINLSMPTFINRITWN